MEPAESAALLQVFRAGVDGTARRARWLCYALLASSNSMLFSLCSPDHAKLVLIDYSFPWKTRTIQFARLSDLFSLMKRNLYLFDVTCRVFFVFCFLLDDDDAATTTVVRLQVRRLPFRGVRDDQSARRFREDDAAEHPGEGPASQRRGFALFVSNLALFFFPGGSRWWACLSSPARPSRFVASPSKQARTKTWSVEAVVKNIARSAERQRSSRSVAVELVPNLTASRQRLSCMGLPMCQAKMSCQAGPALVAAVGCQPPAVCGLLSAILARPRNPSGRGFSNNRQGERATSR